MRTRMLLTGVVLFVVGLVVGLFTPTTRAQAVDDTCAAPWTVEHSPSRGSNGGFYALKLNQCTGEVHIFATNDMTVSAKDTWFKLAVKPQ